MPASHHNPPNWHSPQRWLPWFAVACVLGYLGLFFGQPSLFGLADETGTTLSRWYDLTLLLIGEQLASGLTGHGRFVPTFLDRVPIIVAGFTWLAIAEVTGRSLLRWAQFDEQLSRLERLALNTLAGLACLSTWMLFVGLAGGLSNRYPLLLSVAAWVAISFVWYRRLGGANSTPDSAAAEARNLESNQPLQVSTHLDRWLSRLLMVGVVGLGILIGWGSLITPFEFDVVEYHLQAPKEYLQDGVIRFNDRNVYANMPLGTEMHTLAWMTLIGRDTPDAWWWGGLIGKFITGCFSLITAILLGGFIARHLGRLSGWAAAACYLAVPGGAHVATAGLIDSVVGSYLLAATIVWTLAWHHHHSWKALLVFSLFAGAAGATKYPGIAFAVVPAVLVAIAWTLTHRSSVREHARQLMAVTIGLSLTCIPWLVKNLWTTGNPVYPLMSSWFGCRALSAAQVAQWQSAHATPTIEGSSFSLAAVQASLHQVLLGSPFLSPVGVPLAMLGILAYCWNRRSLSWLGSWPVLIVWIMLVWFVATHRIDRFWLPAVPMIAGLGGVGAHWLGKRIGVALPMAAMLLGVGYCSFLLVAGHLGDNRLLASLAELRNDASTEEQPGRLPASTHWINNNLHRNDRVLLVGEARVFDFIPQVDYATCFNTSLAEELLVGKEADDQRRELNRLGINYMMVNWGEIARYRSPGNYGFSSWPQLEDIEKLVDEGVLEPVNWPVVADRAQLFRVVSPAKY